MSKLINRKQVGYTIDKKILEEFNKLTVKLGSNKSRVVEILMEKWVKENDKKYADGIKQNIFK